MAVPVANSCVGGPQAASRARARSPELDAREAKTGGREGRAMAESRFIGKFSNNV